MAVANALKKYDGGSSVTNLGAREIKAWLLL
jgi:hypothetical protein